jgi:hypothetical protein
MRPLPMKSEFTLLKRATTACGWVDGGADAARLKLMTWYLSARNALVLYLS